MTKRPDRDNLHPAKDRAAKSGSARTPRAGAPKLYVGDAWSTRDRSADRSSLKQVRFTFVILGIVAVAYVVYLVVSGQADDFVRALVGVDLAWIAAGVVCFLFYYVFGVLAFAVLAALDHDSPVGYRDLMSVEASGVFFMRLTPGGAGVIPSQIYRLTRAGLSPAEATALQSMRFTLYEAGEGIFAAIMLVLCGGYFLETFADVRILGLDVTLIGIFMFAVKFVQVSVAILICLLPRPIMALAHAALRAGRALHLVSEERCERFRELVSTQVDTFARAFRNGAAHPRVLIAAELITLVQLGCMYALPYFVLRAFGLEADLVICLASGSMVELLVNAIPLPGGAGGAEVGFSYLFGGMFGWHLSAGLVIWRGIEYLLPVLIAAPCMGMRSASGESIYRRAVRWRANFGRILRRDRSGLERPQGIAYKPKRTREEDESSE
ncbi:lysylphosphatidylglycerol synthase transmembrane domain-containing protein [Collinsella intestinalis]|uniref:lysylphosphatidylglycerol synthase transmembrane domain-containing protein n=1 Tax=Collinsella intestinalis TaxID=147207 RepID=UPI00315D1F58